MPGASPPLPLSSPQMFLLFRMLTPWVRPLQGYFLNVSSPAPSLALNIICELLKGLFSFKGRIQIGEQSGVT